MKLKDMSEDDPSNEDNVPIAVQIFLWRQTTPFMRPRFGKVHESTCTVSNYFTIYNSFKCILILNEDHCK